jgi:hypothetical protein
MTKMRNLLALIVVTGFLTILGVMLSGQVIILDNPTMQLMFGSLTTAFGIVLQWFFGSSHGSEHKTELLAAAPAVPNTPPPRAPTLQEWPWPKSTDKEIAE